MKPQKIHSKGLDRPWGGFFPFDENQAAEFAFALPAGYTLAHQKFVPEQDVLRDLGPVGLPKHALKREACTTT